MQRGFYPIIVVVVSNVIVHMVVDTRSENVGRAATEWDVVVCRPGIRNVSVQ